MPKHPVCPACQRWRCNECGWIRAAANSNGGDQQQYCSRCRDITNGTVLEVRHSRPDILEIHLTSTTRRTSEISELTRNTQYLRELIKSLIRFDPSYENCFQNVEKANLQQIKTTTLIRLLQELDKHQHIV